MLEPTYSILDRYRHRPHRDKRIQKRFEKMASIRGTRAAEKTLLLSLAGSVLLAFFAALKITEKGDENGSRG